MIPIELHGGGAGGIYGMHEDGGGNGVGNNANRQPPPNHEENDGQENRGK